LLLIIAAAALAGITQSIEGYIDYGAEIAVAALVGVAVRLNSGRATDVAAIAGSVLVATVTMSLLAIKTLDLAGVEAGSATAAVAATFVVLAVFRTTGVPHVPPLLAPALRWLGRNTLVIYAAHLALFQLTAFALRSGDA
jgi:fucose 4-O-acetylase-like acetyltransferase